MKGFAQGPVPSGFLAALREGTLGLRAPGLSASPSPGRLVADLQSFFKHIFRKKCSSKSVAVYLSDKLAV